jgi:hypothetical protein
MLILKDYKELKKGDLLFARVLKDNLIISAKEADSLNVNLIFKRNHSFKVEKNHNIVIPLNELSIDFMDPKEVTANELHDYFKGNISYEELTGYLEPNNGYIFKGKISYDLSELDEYLNKINNIDDVDVYSLENVLEHDKFFNDMLETDLPWDYDVFFKENKHLLYLFIQLLFRAKFNDYIYSFDQIKESIKVELDYLNKKTENRSLLLMSYFVEIHSQESNYFMFNKIPNLLDVYKSYLNKLIELDDNLAIQAKAYLCYEGAFFWNIDYLEAEKLLKKLYLNGDVDAANTLGYLYYYHLVDYNKAFMYFSIGAANGNDESKIKLSDCLKYGYGCQKNEIVAYKTLDDLYEKTKSKFLEQKFYSKFPDCALRLHYFHKMKSLFKDEELSLRQAKREIIEAKASIIKRMALLDYVGDNDVYNNILKEYNKYKFKKPEEYYDLDSLYKFDEIISSAFINPDNVYFELTPLGNDKQVLKIFSDDYSRLFLEDYVDYGEAYLTGEISIFGFSNNTKNLSGSINDLKFMYSKNNCDVAVFFKTLNDTFFLADPFVVTPFDIIDKGPMHKMAVCLRDNQKLCDELPFLASCDDIDVSVNDRVYIEDNVCVNVYKVINIYEGDLIGYFDSYPKVISKALDNLLTN